MLALLGTHHILHVSGKRVKFGNFAVMSIGREFARVHWPVVAADKIHRLSNFAFRTTASVLRIGLLVQYIRFFSMAIEEQPVKTPDLIELFFSGCKTVLLQSLLTGNATVTCVTYLLTCLFHGAESFSRSQPVLSYSRNSPHFMELEVLLPYPPPAPFLSHISTVHAHHPDSWRSILISSSHLHLGFPSGLFPLGFPTKTLYAPLPHPLYMPHPSHSSRFDHPNNIWWPVQMIKLVSV